MDVEILACELNDIRQQLKEKESELEKKAVALMQQMEENQTLNTQIERIEHESTQKIEVFTINFSVSLLTSNQYITAVFTKCQQMQSSVLPTVGIFVCLSVRLSHAGTESKQRKLGSRNLHKWIAKGL